MPVSPAVTYTLGFNAKGDKLHMRNVWQSKTTPTQNPDLFLSLAHVTSESGEAYVVVAIAQHATQCKATVLGGFMDAEAATSSFAFYAQQQPAVSLAPAGGNAAVGGNFACEALSSMAVAACVLNNGCMSTNPPPVLGMQNCLNACTDIGNAILRACQALEDSIDDILNP